MNSIGVSGLVLLLSSAAVGAGAAPGSRPIAVELAVPGGWRYDGDLSRSLATDMLDNRYFDGQPVDVGAEAYLAPDGAALYLLWIAGRESTEEPSLAVRRAFDEIRAAPLRSGGALDAAEFVGWREESLGDLASATFEWRHRSNETVTLVRALMYVTPARQLRQARAECVMNAEAIPALRPACEAAVASLSFGDGPRGPLGELPSAGELRLAAPDAPDPAADPEAGIDTGESPSLGPPTRGAVLYEAEPARNAGGRDSYVLYVAGAVLLIVGIYLTVRRRAGDPHERENPP